MQECIVTDIKSEGKSRFSTCLYRTPREIHDQLERFYKLLDFLLFNFNDLNPYFYVLLGDFNGK